MKERLFINSLCNRVYRLKLHECVNRRTNLSTLSVNKERPLIVIFINLTNLTNQSKFVHVIKNFLTENILLSILKKCYLPRKNHQNLEINECLNISNKYIDMKIIIFFSYRNNNLAKPVWVLCIKSMIVSANTLNKLCIILKFLVF